ncbi:MAG TPA: hypothetical protein DEP84_37700, partial [Chloroflexi bacterium]|nr:hypothetical protein [Chloroflexota bacterium]
FCDPASRGRRALPDSRASPATGEARTMHSLLIKLTGGDRRSIGRVGEVVAEVLADPSLFQVVFEGMLSDNPVLRMRCADAVEKLTSEHPEYLRPYKQTLLQEVARIDQQEIRWHVAQLLPRLELSADERNAVVAILLEYLGDQSKIVKTFSMQALADIAERDEDLRPQIIAELVELTRSGSPAMKSRGRRLLERLTRDTLPAP